MSEFQPNLQAIGARVRAERVRLGMSAKELAERIGVTPQHLNDIEKGRRGVTRQLAIEIAAHLDWYPDWIDMMMGRLPTHLLKDDYEPFEITAVRTALR